MKSMKTMNFVLLIIGITTGIFVLVQTWLYLLTGSYMETMTTMWFTYVLGECGVMGAIKAVKVLLANAQINKEAKELELKNQQEKIAADKRELAAMAEMEAGK